MRPRAYPGKLILPKKQSQCLLFNPVHVGESGSLKENEPVSNRAEALRPASGSRSTLAAARALNISAKLLYQWQKAAQQPF